EWAMPPDRRFVLPPVALTQQVERPAAYARDFLAPAAALYGRHYNYISESLLDLRTAFSHLRSFFSIHTYLLLQVGRNGIVPHQLLCNRLPERRRRRAAIDCLLRLI